MRALRNRRASARPKAKKKPVARIAKPARKPSKSFGKKLGTPSTKAIAKRVSKGASKIRAKKSAARPNKAGPAAKKPVADRARATKVFAAAVKSATDKSPTAKKQVAGPAVGTAARRPVRMTSDHGAPDKDERQAAPKKARVGKVPGGTAAAAADPARLAGSDGMGGKFGGGVMEVDAGPSAPESSNVIGSVSTTAEAATGPAETSAQDETPATLPIPIASFTI